MGKAKIVAITTAAVILVTSSVVFADKMKSNFSNTFVKHFGSRAVKADPDEMLKKQKENIQQKVAAGKLTQEEADKLIARAEKRISDMKAFDSMTLEQKKEKLLNDYKANLDKWDGNGPGPMGPMGRDSFRKAPGKGFEGKGKNSVTGNVYGRPGGKMPGQGMMRTMDPSQMAEKQKEYILKRVADGKLSQEEADKQIAAIDKRVAEMKAFESLTLDQKKEKLLNDFTTALNKRVSEGKLTQEKADQSIAKFKEGIEKWDGTRPPSFGKGMEPRHGAGNNGNTVKQ